jgi:C4-dicarboxylate-binding protein DctP
MNLDLETTWEEIMKNIMKFWIISAVSLLTALPALSADVTMRISLQLPLKSHLGQNLLLFKEEVESKSGGSIAVEIYDSAQLYKDKEVPAAVGSGSIEAGVASLTRYVGDIPAVDIFYQPFLFDSEAKVRKAVAKGSEIRGPIDVLMLELFPGTTSLHTQSVKHAQLTSSVTTNRFRNINLIPRASLLVCLVPFEGRAREE